MTYSSILISNGKDISRLLGRVLVHVHHFSQNYEIEVIRELIQ